MCRTLQGLTACALARGAMWTRVEGDLSRIGVAREVTGDCFASRDADVPLSVITRALLSQQRRAAAQLDGLFGAETGPREVIQKVTGRDSGELSCHESGPVGTRATAPAPLWEISRGFLRPSGAGSNCPKGVRLRRAMPASCRTGLCCGGHGGGGDHAPRADPAGPPCRDCGRRLRSG